MSEVLIRRAEAIEADLKERRKKEARRKDEAEMKDLAGREADVWREVAERVGAKQTKGYEDVIHDNQRQGVARGLRTRSAHDFELVCERNS